MINNKENRKKIYLVIWWIFFIATAFGLISTAITGEWVRWKWGYYNLDQIPYAVILLILWFINEMREKTDVWERLDRLEGKNEE